MTNSDTPEYRYAMELAGEVREFALDDPEVTDYRKRKYLEVYSTILCLCNVLTAEKQRSERLEKALRSAAKELRFCGSQIHAIEAEQAVERQ